MRRYCQESEKPSAVLARELGVNVKTINEHRERYLVDDLPMGRNGEARNASPTRRWTSSFIIEPIPNFRSTSATRTFAENSRNYRDQPYGGCSKKLTSIRCPGDG